MEAIEEPIPLTAPQIAIEHFARELIAHANPETTGETVVILHDACYGHRYSRLKTTKSTLSMIVERPERIHASVLGASTAYVRLGAHHAGAKNAPHPDRTQPAPPPFKIRRTGRSMDITSPYVTNVHGTAWMNELRVLCNAAGPRLAAGEKELSRGTTPTDPEKRKLHEGDLYLCPESLNAFQGALGGVAEAVDTMFDPSSQTTRAFVAIRPPGHHCSADYPSGFCWLNNVHVGIEYAAQTHGLTHAAILDFDLHHGDGSQVITWERNSKNNIKRLNAKPTSKLKLGPDIGYYSLHDINSYPCEMGDDEKVQAASVCIENAHGQSIWNVHLQPWKNEEEFWRLYETRYRILLDKAKVFLEHHTSRIRADGRVQPKAAVFISAGFDASEWEGAGMQRHKVNVPTEFYARFTRDVVQLAQATGSGCEGRVISVLEGGYSDRALCSGVLSHLSGLCATPVDALKQEESGVMALDQMMRGLGINGTTNANALHYDKTWWSDANLTALEMKVNPPPPPGPGKRVRTGPQPTYATPTESFAYKVVDPNKFARSISGTMRESYRPMRPPTPPAPEVDWVVATQELSKLLIPIDRETRSCMAEDLAPVRTKKDRQSAMPVLSSEESTKPRQLRDRKTKASAAYAESVHSDEVTSLRSESRNSRRQTIAELPTSSDHAEPGQQRRLSRRLSSGSTLSSTTGELNPTPPPVPALPSMALPNTNGAMNSPPVAVTTGVQVKKTRGPPTKPKKAAASASAPVSPARLTKPSGLLPGSTNGTAAQKSDGVDALTSGMKTVTLKVGSREEHDRKQKEKIDAERRARGLKAAETRKANAAAKKAAKEGNAKTEVERPTQAVKENTAPLAPSSGVETMGQPEIYVEPLAEMPATAEPAPVEFILPEYSMAGAPWQDQNQPPSAGGGTESIASPDTQQQMPLAPLVESAPSYVQPAKEESMPLPTFEQAHPALQDSTAHQFIHERDTAIGNGFPPPPRPQHGTKLPIWSSTGPIPFATNASERPQSSNGPWSGFQTNESRDTVPSTVDSRNGVSRSMLVGVEDTTIVATPPVDVKEEASIWDVPETPRH